MFPHELYVIQDQQASAQSKPYFNQNYVVDAITGFEVPVVSRPSDTTVNPLTGLSLESYSVHTSYKK